METQLNVAKPINNEIYEAAEVACMTAMEFSPAGQELFAKRDKLIAAIEGKVPRETVRDLEELYLEFSCVYGNELFAMGLAIGRDPALLFDLPEAQ